MPSDIDDSTRFRIPEEVLVEELQGEAVLLDLSSGTYFGLDPVGTRIWELIADRASVGEVRRRLLQEYQVEEERLREDLEALVRDLLGRGLLVRSRGG